MGKKALLFTLLVSVLAIFLGSTQAESEILYIFGKEGAGDFENEYLRRNDPDFEWTGVEAAEGNNDAKYLAMQMQTKNDCFDVYAAGYAYCGLTRLNEKGFCMDLSCFPELAEISGKYHPFIQQAIRSEGKLFAIPIGISVSGWGYNRYIAEEMGLQESMPSTYSELFSMLAWWLEEGSDLYPEYELLVGPESFKTALCSKVIHDYVNYCTLAGIKMDFEDEIITKLIRELDELDTDELDRREAMAADGIAYNKPSLLIMDCNYADLNGNGTAGLVPLKIGVTEDDTVIIADIYCFALNPNTSRPEMAATYISTFMENMDEEERIMLFCDESVQPIENPEYADDIEYNSMIRQGLLDNTRIDHDERERLLYENEKERQLIEASRWYISREQIDLYFQLTKKMAVRCQNILERNSANGTLEIQKDINRYGKGEISSNQFLRSANQVLQMIIGEGE